VVQPQWHKLLPLWQPMTKPPSDYHIFVTFLGFSFVAMLQNEGVLTEV